MAPIKKKTAERHKRVSMRFQEWFQKNPKTTTKRKIKEFDAICDAEYYHERNQRYSKAGTKLLTVISDELERSRNS